MGAFSYWHGICQGISNWFLSRRWQRRHAAGRHCIIQLPHPPHNATAANYLMLLLLLLLSWRWSDMTGSLYQKIQIKLRLSHTHTITMQIHNAKLINRTNNNNTHTHSRAARERESDKFAMTAPRQIGSAATTWRRHGTPTLMPHTYIRDASLSFYFLADADVGAVVAAWKR